MLLVLYLVDLQISLVELKNIHTLSQSMLPTGHMIDIFTCETPATSMTLSLTGDFLATSHIDELGIYLWSV